MTESIEETQARLVADLTGAGDWKARYRRIIELGRNLPPLPAELQTETYRVKGCQSQVWLHARLDDGRVVLQGTSDSDIVRGLVALVLAVYSNRTPDEVLVHPPSFIDRIGLGESLTQARANGLSSMIRQVKLYAAAFKALAATGRTSS